MNRTTLLPGAFPLTAKYDLKWIRDNALGENAVCQAESLVRRLSLHAGMRMAKKKPKGSPSAYQVVSDLIGSSPDP